MQIKVFKASSMKEAVAKMKAELGDDAVILHTKKYKEGGILGYGSKEMVEITAAIEDEKPVVKKEPEKPQRPIMPQSVLSQYKTNGTPEGVAMAERETSPSPLSNTKSSVDTSAPKTNDVEDDSKSSMMKPNVNQASPLEAAMNPVAKNTSKVEQPMPYENDNSPMPYEVDISSRSDLNTSKSDKTISPEVQESDSKFIQSRSVELTEADVENEPDEKVYTAEPEVNKDIAQSNDTVVGTSVNASVPSYNDTATTVEVTNTSNEPTQSMNADSVVQAQSPATPESSISQSQSQIQPQSPPVQNLQQPPQPQVPQPQPVQVSPQQSQPGVSSSAPNPQPTVETPIAEQPVAHQPVAPQVPTDQATNANQQQIDLNQPLTPAQLAQAQAMMIAQFNQLQMAQAMQQAMAQAQAQQMPQQVYIQSQSQPQSQPSQHSQSESSESDHESQEKIKKLENEIAQMKALLAQVIGKDSSRGTISLHEALRKQEVSEDILNDMAAHAEAGGTLSDSQSREAKSTLVKFLNENINFSEGIKLNRHGVRIVSLLGTTGVGKTTTLAKIAAKFVLEQGITAALITADTYRISAVEQLRTYSDILGLPLEIVYSPAELSKAINKHRNRDLILIDTAGRSQHNDYQMKELQEFLSANQRIEKHIVLSTTTKSSDAKDILEKFSVCEPEKIIFTKTDETASVGLIFNLLYKQKLSLSYVTNGQSVPDDITPASAETLADLLLKRAY